MYFYQRIHNFKTTLFKVHSQHSALIEFALSNQNCEDPSLRISGGGLKFMEYAKFSTTKIESGGSDTKYYLTNEIYHWLYYSITLSGYYSYPLGESTSTL